MMRRRRRRRGGCLLAEADTVLGAVVGMSGSRAGINQARTRLRVEGKSGGGGGGGGGGGDSITARPGPPLWTLFPDKVSFSVCLSVCLSPFSLSHSLIALYAKQDAVAPVRDPPFPNL